MPQLSDKDQTCIDQMRTMSMGVNFAGPANRNGWNIIIPQLNFEPDVMIVKSIAYAGANAEGNQNYLLYCDAVDDGVIANFATSVVDAGADVACVNLQEVNNVFQVTKKLQTGSLMFFQLQDNASVASGPQVATTHALGNLSVLIQFVRYALKKVSP